MLHPSEIIPAEAPGPRTIRRNGMAFNSPYAALLIG
jgi:hypothetical protein